MLGDKKLRDSEHEKQKAKNTQFDGGKGGEGGEARNKKIRRKRKGEHKAEKQQGFYSNMRSAEAIAITHVEQRILQQASVDRLRHSFSGILVVFLSFRELHDNCSDSDGYELWYILPVS